MMGRDFSDDDERLEELLEEMTAEEDAVTDILTEDDILLSLPEGFFDQSLPVINAYLGGHDETIVTERVREYCKLMHEYVLDLNAMADYQIEHTGRGILGQVKN